MRKREERLAKDGFGYIGPEGTWVTDRSFMLWSEEPAAEEETLWGPSRDLFAKRWTVASRQVQWQIDVSAVLDMLKAFKVTNRELSHSGPYTMMRWWPDGNVIVVQDWERKGAYDGGDAFMSAWIGGLAGGGIGWAGAVYYMRWWPPADGVVWIGKSEKGQFLRWETADGWFAVQGCTGEKIERMFARERERRGI
jgi:hypothetical protein